jgi:hypothetical protein
MKTICKREKGKNARRGRARRARMAPSGSETGNVRNMMTVDPCGSVSVGLVRVGVARGQWGSSRVVRVVTTTVGGWGTIPTVSTRWIRRTCGRITGCTMGGDVGRGALVSTGAIWIATRRRAMEVRFRRTPGWSVLQSRAGREPTLRSMTILTMMRWLDGHGTRGSSFFHPKKILFPLTHLPSLLVGFRCITSTRHDSR